jgi:hypothetical protein
VTWQQNLNPESSEAAILASDDGSVVAEDKEVVASDTKMEDINRLDTGSPDFDDGKDSPSDEQILNRLKKAEILPDGLLFKYKKTKPFPKGLLQKVQARIVPSFPETSEILADEASGKDSKSSKELSRRTVRLYGSPGTVVLGEDVDPDDEEIVDTIPRDVWGEKARKKKKERKKREKKEKEAAEKERKKGDKSGDKSGGKKKKTGSTDSDAADSRDSTDSAEAAGEGAGQGMLKDMLDQIPGLDALSEGIPGIDDLMNMMGGLGSGKGSGETEEL